MLFKQHYSLLLCFDQQQLAQILAVELWSVTVLHAHMHRIGVVNFAEL